MSRYSVVVCIPTYRRRPKLLVLLEALYVQTFSQPYLIVVGNNDSVSIGAVSQAVDLHEIFVEERGVSAVRNRLISYVLELEDEVKWIAFLDDDQKPAVDWLARLIEAGERNCADIVGGPVTHLPERKTFWAAGATCTTYLPRIDGPVKMLNEAGNLLLAASFLRSVNRPPFDLSFGYSGGEDYEFFLYARAIGARMYWTSSAMVDEIIPFNRLTLKGLFWRSYTGAAYQARADLIHIPPFEILKNTLRQIIVTPILVLRSLITQKSLGYSASIMVRRSATSVGTLAGLLGVRVNRYGANAKDASL